MKILDYYNNYKCREEAVAKLRSVLQVTKTITFEELIMTVAAHSDYLDDEMKALNQRQADQDKIIKDLLIRVSTLESSILYHGRDK